MFLIVFILYIFLHSERLANIQFLFLFLMGLCLYFTCFQLRVLSISIIESVVWQWVIQFFQNLLFRYFFIFGSILLFHLFKCLLNFLVINLKFWFIKLVLNFIYIGFRLHHCRGVPSSLIRIVILSLHVLNVPFRLILSYHMGLKHLNIILR